MPTNNLKLNHRWRGFESPRCFDFTLPKRPRHASPSDSCGLRAQPRSPLGPYPGSDTKWSLGVRFPHLARAPSLGSPPIRIAFHDFKSEISFAPSHSRTEVRRPACVVPTCLSQAPMSCHRRERRRDHFTSRARRGLFCCRQQRNLSFSSDGCRNDYGLSSMAQSYRAR